MVIVLWLIFAFVVGALGSSRKLGFWGAFLLSLLLSPLIGGICVALSERKSDVKMKEEISSTNKIMKLKELSELKEKGAITEDEYERLKKEIIGQNVINN